MILPYTSVTHTYLPKTKPILVLELYHILKADVLMKSAAETTVAAPMKTCIAKQGSGNQT